MKVAPRIPRVPLALTLLTTTVLLLVPTLLLRRMPRPQAIGLEKLMANASLMQSFRPTPERPVPQLWRERLGDDTAAKLWRFQTRSWWQFWDGHADGQPFLALSARGLPEPILRSVPVPPLRMGDLAIFPPDPLARQILNDRLQPQVRRSSGVRLRCLLRLEREQAVFWRPSGLGVLLGPLAPLLQNFQEGCLSLNIDGVGLNWKGEAASVEGMVLQVPEGAFGPPRPPQMMALPSDVLLEVHGGSLDQLLSGLLARELIRQPLAERYGLGPEQIKLLRQTPFRLLLRPRPDKSFQASLELTVAVGGHQEQWKAGLKRLSQRLENEGLRPSSKEPQSPMLWRRKDGVGLGGWIWNAGQNQRGEEQITLFLGPQPSQLVPWQGGTSGGKEDLLLVARPNALADLGLLPPDLPEVVRRSTSLWVSADPFPGYGQGAPLSQLQGSLELQP